MKQRSTLFAIILSGIGASLCCVAPLLFVMLGIGGAWIGNLTQLEPYRPLFVGLTLVFFGFGFYELYLAPRACEIGKLCADEKVVGRQRVIFWLVVLPVLGFVAVPWLAPLFY